MVLSILSENIEMTAAMISMITSRSQNWLRNTCNVLFLLPSWRTFSPFSLRISSARSVDSPRLSVLNSFSNSSPEQFQKFFSVIHTRLLFFLFSDTRHMPGVHFSISQISNIIYASNIMPSDLICLSRKEKSVVYSAISFSYIQQRNETFIA